MRGPLVATDIMPAWRRPLDHPVEFPQRRAKGHHPLIQPVGRGLFGGKLPLQRLPENLGVLQVEVQAKRSHRAPLG